MSAALGTVSDRWPTKSVALHWVSAAVIMGMGAAGFVMSDLAPDSSLRLLLSRSHTLFGFTLMALTALRLVTRWRGPSPDPLPLPPLHRRGVDLVHKLIYVVVFALGASGAFTAARSTWPEYIRGAIARAPELEHVASREVHESLVFALVALIALHVGGVVVQELRGGGALRRMLPRSSASGAGAGSPREAR